MPRTKLHPPSGDNSKSDKNTEKTAKAPKTSKTEVTPEMIEDSSNLMKKVMNAYDPSLEARPSGGNAYLEQKKRKQEETEHIQKKLPEELAEMFATYNNLLANTPVSLKRLGSNQNPGNTVCLQATLPLKPGDTNHGKRTKRYDLSVNGSDFHYSENGLKAAYAEAEELVLSLARKKFTWETKYLGRIAQQAILAQAEAEKPKTIGELLDEFEAKYFLKKKRCRQSEGTFGKYRYYLNRFLSKDSPLSFSAIIDAIDQTEAGTADRVQLVSILSVFCKHFNFEFDFHGFKHGYTPIPRVLPNDEQILEGFDKFKPHVQKNSQWEAYQQIYGFLATYGLRPHEFFAINWGLTLEPSNTHNVVYLDKTITDGIKTGNRSVFPLYPDWVEKFDLMNPKPLVSKATLKSKVKMISQNFNRNEIGFPPYNLRHAYAIRGHMLQYSVKDMSVNMGHSYEVHTGTYQKYLSEEQRQEAYDLMLAKAEGKPEASELEALRVENSNLKSERVESDAERAAMLRIQAELLRQNREQLGDLQEMGNRNREQAAALLQLQAELAERPQTDNPVGLE